MCHHSKSPLQVNQHELQRLSPLLLAVEMQLDTVETLLVAYLRLVDLVGEVKGAPFLDRVQELLEAVEKRDHALVKLGVPEQAETSVGEEGQLGLTLDVALTTERYNLWEKIVVIRIVTKNT